VRRFESDLRLDVICNACGIELAPPE